MFEIRHHIDLMIEPKKSQIYADVEKVRKLAAKIYFDLLEE